MHNVRTKKQINRSARDVWEVIDDFGGIYRFHPLVETSPVISDKSTGLGAERQCNFYGGGAVKERITGYDKGKSMNIEIYDSGPFPLKKAKANLAVRPISDNRSEVDFEIDFVPKYGPVGWLMAKTRYEVAV